MTDFIKEEVTDSHSQAMIAIVAQRCGNDIRKQAGRGKKHERKVRPASV
jgi:hypothetical protein